MMRVPKWTNSLSSRAGALRNVAAMFDQGIVSLGNFATQVVLVRAMSSTPEGMKAYGFFGVLVQIMLLLNAVQAAVVIYPLTIKAAASRGDGVRKIGGRGLFHASLLAPIFGMAIAVVAAFSGRYELAIWVMVAITFSQIQETLRRTLMADLRYAATIPGDLISYVGQAGLIWTIAHRGGVVSLERVFEAMALTSVLAAAVQFLQVRPTLPRWSEVTAYMRESFVAGRWLLMANLMSIFSEPLFIWYVAYALGLNMLGAWNGISNVMRPVNPAIIAFCSVLMPTVARQYSDEGVSSAKPHFFRQLSLGFLPLLPLFLVPLIFPEASIKLLYGQNTALVVHAGLLRLIVVVVMLHFFHDIIGAYLNALRLSRYSFMAQMGYAAVIIGVAMPLTSAHGLRGAAVGCMIASAGMIAIQVYFIMRSMRATVEVPLRGFAVKPIPEPAAVAA